MSWPFWVASEGAPTAGDAGLEVVPYGKTAGTGDTFLSTGDAVLRTGNAVLPGKAATSGGYAPVCNR